MRNREQVGESGVDAVRESQNCRLLVCQNGCDAPRGDDGWNADESAGAENDVWAERGKSTTRGEHTEGNTPDIGEILH